MLMEFYEITQISKVNKQSAVTLNKREAKRSGVGLVQIPLTSKPISIAPKLHLSLIIPSEKPAMLSDMIS